MKKFVSTFLAAVLAAGALAGCGKAASTAPSGGASNGASGGSTGVVTITMPTYRTGADAGAAFFEPQVERFNAKYEGKYKIVLEESPQNTHGDRIKQLAQQNQLPPLFQINDKVWVRDYLVANNKLEDLSPLLENADLKKLLFQESIDFCTIDGKLIAMPISVIRPTGLFYNSALFNPEKPVTEFSWEEFGKALGENSIAYQTAEGGWTANLMFTGMIGSIEGGQEILRKGATEDKLTDFNNPVFVEAVGLLQDSMMNHSWNGAVGAVYADAANTFYANQTAVLPDGTWIINKMEPTEENKKEWSNGFDGTKVIGDYFPGNVAISDPYVFDWMVSAGQPDDVKALCFAFLEFINSPEEIEAFILGEGGMAPNLEYSQKFLDEISKNSLLTDFSTKTNDKTTFVPYFNAAIDDSLFQGEFSNLLSPLSKGQITPEEFCEQLTRAAQE